VPGLPDVAVSPLSGVISLLGSGSSASPQQVGLTIPSSAPATAGHGAGVLGRIARWSRGLLKGLW
jgi:hypothetical protein